ncbi:MAG: type II secretion system F family protein [Candidatus Saccharimonas sp.]|nr:type II secretion system F family protein [Planctomycetaceae bacterium]
MIVPPWFFPAFYGTCGVLIVVLLYRIWSKNRAAAVQETVARRTVVPPQPTAVPTAPAMKATAVPPPIPAPMTHAAAVTPTAARSGIPEPYIAASSSTILRGDATPTWEDRRLLEHHGVLSRGETNPMPRVLAEDIPGTDDSDRKFGSLLNPTFAVLLPESPERREQARKDLLAAGYHTPHAVENLSATRYVYMMLALIVFGALLLIVPARLEPWAIGGLVFGPMLGWALPMLRVRGQAEARKLEIEKAMPDLLDMLNMCVSQGLTVPDSLKRILRDFRGVYPALSHELSIVTEQTQITNLHTALENFGQRVDLPEVHSFTSLLIQTERMGTSISDALTTYSDTMRESLRQRADEKGNRATFRLLFPTVLCLMPAVYLFLLGPAVIGLSNFFYSGGRDSLDSGSSAIQRLNAQRTGAANR